MPDISPCEYILDIFYKVGPIGIKWAELAAFQAITGIRLSGWEAETIKRLSEYYEGYANKYEGKNETQPYLPIEAKKAKASHIQNILRQPVK